MILGMADFSLHSLAHSHHNVAQVHTSHGVDCQFTDESQDAFQINESTDECLRCGQFIIHNAFAVSDLFSVQTEQYTVFQNVILLTKLISIQVPSAFLRGPPRK